MLDYILLAIIFLSFAGIVYLILSKFPQLASIRLEIIPSEQQLTIRNRIIANRLKSKVSDRKLAILKTIRPFWLNFTSLFWKFYRKILEKERQLQQLAMSDQEKEAAKTKVAELLEQAKAATQDAMFIRAERLYINAISLAPRNLDVYDGLARMYWEQKDYQKANETLKYLINLAKKRRRENDKESIDNSELNSKLTRYYLEIGELYQYQGDNDSAMDNFAEAVKIEGNNPKALDQLLKISIIMRKIDFAKEILEKIKKVNSDNQKIAEWENEVKSL